MTPREAITEIKRLIDGSSPGADKWASKKVSEYCACLRAHSPQVEKIAEIKEWADYYLSERKWQKVNGGAMQLARWVDRACEVVEASLPKE